MPFWNFFAFDSRSVAEAVLQPAEEAIRSRNLPLWQKVFNLLSRSHYSPRVSYGRYSPNETPLTGCVAKKDTLSAELIPEESAFGLRRTLQTFVEQIATHRLEGKFPRPRHWVCSEVSWPKILKSRAEVDQMEAFKSQIIARQTKAPDPFWCLESNSAVDSNYAAPETVKSIAESESRVALFRNLGRREDLDGEIKALARELANAGLFLELAASQDLALYFREDGT